MLPPRWRLKRVPSAQGARLPFVNCDDDAVQAHEQGEVLGGLTRSEGRQNEREEWSLNQM